ncbi:MAG: flagellar biosynthesis protein FlhF [bacterium]
MKVKRYEALTLQEALLNVKRELGSDAVILQTRKFNKGGIFGFMGKNMVEVLAATDVNTPGSVSERVGVRVDEENPAGRNNQKEAMLNLKDEIQEIKSALRTIISHERAADVVKPFPETFGDVYLKLIENDVDAPIAQDIIRAIDETLSEGEKREKRAVEEAMGKQLKRLVKISGEIDSKGSAQKIVAFVGPTGVGKTTTIAKLATHFTLSKRRKVGLITIDTYRIAAVEQLKVYADILDVPMRVVYNSDDMKRSADIFSDKDVVLIDTAGRSHRNQPKIQELKEILSVCYPLDIHLVINVSTRLKELADIAERFRTLSFNHFLFTKLDEAETYGNIVNLISKFNTGVSYITYGQSVPDEIQAATAERIAPLILGAPLQQALLS